MSNPATELVQRTAALDTKDGERFMDQLRQSLNEPAAEELDAAWEAEIGRRLAEYDRGKVTVIDAKEVFAKARHLAR